MLRQQLFHHYRHYLRPDNLSQAIGGTLGDNLRGAQPEVRGCLGVYTRHPLQNKSPRRISLSSPAVLQLNCQVASSDGQPGIHPAFGLSDTRKRQSKDQSGDDAADQSNTNRCSSTSSSLTSCIKPSVKVDKLS